MAFVNRSSFEANGVTAKIEGDIEGTVEVTLFGETRRVRAVLAPKYNWIFAYGIEGMYRTGQKWWAGSIRSNGDGEERVNFGRYDNHPKFNKTNIRFKA